MVPLKRPAARLLAGRRPCLFSKPHRQGAPQRPRPEGLARRYLRINGVWEDHIHMVRLNEPGKG